MLKEMNRFPLFALLALMTVVLGAAYIAGPAAASTRRVARVHRPLIRLAPVNSRDPVSTAAAIAEGYWGAIPCGGQISLIANRPLPAGLDPTTDGWVTFDSSSGPDDLSAPATSYTNCTISLAHSRWPTWRSMEQDWGMFCLTVVHELGHLLGQQHSLAPRSVMAPMFTSDANVPAVCNQTWLSGWRANGNR